MTATLIDVVEADAVPAGESAASVVEVVAVPAGGGVQIRSLAIGLWAVVGSLLGYGIVVTAIKASALFG
jgi:hypothetical protein